MASVNLFFDACALVKRYVLEGRGTHVMQRLFAHEQVRSAELICSALIEPEVVKAITRKRLGQLATNHALEQFYADYNYSDAQIKRRAFHVIGVATSIVNGAARLLSSHRDWKVGAADVVHLQTALAVRDRMRPDDVLIFVSSDGGLVQAAQEVGLPAFDPEVHDIAAFETLLQ